MSIAGTAIYLKEGDSTEVRKKIIPTCEDDHVDEEEGRGQEEKREPQMLVRYFDSLASRWK